MPFFETEYVSNRSVYCNLDHYLSVTRMYRDGGDPEIQILAALLNTIIYYYMSYYSETFRGWTRFGSYEMCGISSNPNVPGLYIKCDPTLE